jgi:hypothetical protein
MQIKFNCLEKIKLLWAVFDDLRLLLDGEHLVHVFLVENKKFISF